MVADSSALPEQVAADALASAFDSAGQRCSALRLLLVQEENAGRVIDLPRGGLMRRPRRPRGIRTDTRSTAHEAPP